MKEMNDSQAYLKSMIDEASLRNPRHLEPSEKDKVDQVCVAAGAQTAFDKVKVTTTS